MCGYRVTDDGINQIRDGPGVLNLTELDDLLNQTDGLTSYAPGWP